MLQCEKLDRLPVLCLSKECELVGACEEVVDKEDQGFAIICEKLCGQPVICEFFDGCVHYQDWKVARSLGEKGSRFFSDFLSI